MNRTIRRLAILFAAICVMMIMAVPAFADTYTNPAIHGWYSPGTPQTYTEPITVKVVVQSRKYVGTSDYINGTFDITLGEEDMDPTSFTVADVLGEFNNQQSVLQANPTYYSIGVLYNMKKLSNGNIYGPVLYNSSGYLLDGWMFRVNGKLPTTTATVTNYNHTYIGDGLSTTNTYIADGDVIYFYTDYPWKDNNGNKLSTYFVSAQTSYSSGVLTVNLIKDQDYYVGLGDAADWYIDDYTYYTPTTNYAASVKDKNGTTVGSLVLHNGVGTCNCTLTSGQDYYISVLGTRNFHTITGLDSNNNALSVSHLYTTIVYEKVNH